MVGVGFEPVFPSYHGGVTLRGWRERGITHATPSNYPGVTFDRTMSANTATTAAFTPAI